MMWRTEKLGDILSLQNGYAFKSAEYEDDGYFVMRITNVQQGYISTHNPKYVRIDNGSKLEKFILEVGDILVSLTGDVGRVGVIENGHLPAALNQRVARVTGVKRELVNIDFLYAYMNSDEFRRQVEDFSHGAAQANVSTKDILSINVPLPPLAEQQHIVAKLDAAFAEIDRAVEIENEKNVQIQRLLSNTIRAKIQKMMVANGSKPLADFCELKNGFAFKSTKYCDTGTPILRISNIQDGSITTDKMVYASQEDYKENLDKYIVKKDALLIAMSGATTGKVGINRSEQDFYLNQRVGMLIPNTSLDRDFLYFFLTTKVNELLNISAGAAQPNLSAKQIREIELPNITLDEQQVFSESINGLKVEIDLLQSACAQKLAQLATVKSAILAQELQPKQSDAA